MKEIKLSKKEMLFLLYALKGYKLRLGYNKAGDDYYKKLLKPLANNTSECIKIEKKLFNKISKNL